MAKFNEQLGVSATPNFVGASKGQTSDKSAGTAIKGFGEILTGLADTADQHIQGNIQNDIETQAFDIYEEFGVGSQAAIDSNATGVGAATPQEIEEAGTTLGRLTAAHNSGTLSQTNFNARLVSVTRQLKSKYPGYGEIIDEMITKRTGVRPESALQRSLMQDYQNASSASQRSAAARQTRIDEAAKYANIDEVGDLTNRSNEDLDNIIRRGIARDMEIARHEKQLSAAQAGNEASREAAVFEAQEFLVQSITAEFSDTVEGLVSKAGLGKTLAETMATAGNDGVFDVADKQAIREGFSSLNDHLQTKLSAQMDSMKLYDPEARSKVTKLLDQKMGILEERIYGDGENVIGILGATTAQLKDAESEMMLNALAGGGDLAYLHNLKELAGPEVVNAAVLEDPTILTGAMSEASKVALSVSSSIARAANEGKVIDPNVPGLTEATRIIQYSQIPQRQKDDAVQRIIKDRFDFGLLAAESGEGHRARAEIGALFLGEGETAWFSALSNEDQKHILNRFMSERFVLGAKKAFTEESPEWNKISQFVSDQTYAKAQEDISSFQSLQAQWGKQTQVVYDDQTGDFVVEYTGPAFSTGRNRTRDKVQSVREAILPINRHVKRLQAAYGEEGVLDFIDLLQNGPNPINIEVSEASPLRKNAKVQQPEAGEDAVQAFSPNIQTLNTRVANDQIGDDVLSNPLTQSGGDDDPIVPGKPQSDGDVPVPKENPVEQAPTRIDYERGFVRNIRNKPMSSRVTEQVNKSLDVLGPEYRVEVTSGGQDPFGTGYRRTGSVRHDRGNAGDLILKKDGKLVKPTEDRAAYLAFVEEAAANGATGIGHYAGWVHIGGGKRVVWGPDGHASSAEADFKAAVKRGWARAKAKTK